MPASPGALHNSGLQSRDPRTTTAPIRSVGGLAWEILATDPHQDQTRGWQFPDDDFDSAAEEQFRKGFKRLKQSIRKGTLVVALLLYRVPNPKDVDHRELERAIKEVSATLKKNPRDCARFDHEQFVLVARAEIDRQRDSDQETLPSEVYKPASDLLVYLRQQGYNSLPDTFPPHLLSEKPALPSAAEQSASTEVVNRDLPTRKALGQPTPARRRPPERRRASAQEESTERSDTSAWRLQQAIKASKGKLRSVVEASGKTQEEIGVLMGYPQASARSNVSYILSPESNPTLKTLIALAEAINKSISDIV